MSANDETSVNRDLGSVDGPTTAHLEAIREGDALPSNPPGGGGAQAAAAIDALPPDSALLVVQHGPNTGARFLLDADVTTVGRDTRSEIFLDDVTVSRRHAEFRRVADGFEVRDVGSLNGTYVNRERIEGGALRSGDEVQIGKYRLTFHPSPHRAAEGS
ncbi:FHA domain-containing protein [Serinibacter arcticus]|uniref:FHA domain-containing protein n=1 Tax=Serinibacter arcticus TaxID=1655435 RepID=A0A2U1ZRU5_9MICO|nr:FHA domain-containing protein [Serinibacter arcticus]PWD49696.1 FHA domain-containing protein [Serinibacter arcticus]